MQLLIILKLRSKFIERILQLMLHKVDILDEDLIIREISNFSPDLIAGGPPCQDFSSAGKRIESENANLTVKFGKIVAICKPNFCLMENVALARNSGAYNSMRNRLLKIGYQLSEMVLNSAFYGVPQIRKRFFVFGWKGKKNYGSKLESWMAEKLQQKPMTVKEYMGPDINIEYYYRHPRNYSRRSVFSVNEPSPTIRGVNRPVPPNYIGNCLDSVSPQTVRPLNLFERSQIQTFPRTWNWEVPCSKSAIETNLGNAVPVNLASIIGDGINFAVS